MATTFKDESLQELDKFTARISIGSAMKDKARDIINRDAYRFEHLKPSSFAYKCALEAVAGESS